MYIKNKKGFTLVELIVVVIIIAILATISFVSYSSYTIDAREGKRATDVASVSKALDLFYVKAMKYPMPDDIYATGIISGKTVSYMGYIGDSVSNMLKLSEVPVDPKTQERYLYAVKTNRKEYQIAQAMEKSTGYHLTGNFKGELSKESVKSMLYAKTGSIDLAAAGVPYITPYGIEIGTGMVKEYLCEDLTEAQLTKLDNLIASMPEGSRFAYSEILSKSYLVGDLMTQEDWCSINDLSIWNSTLSQVPQEIGYLNLGYLTISENPNLTSLPSEIMNLHSLQNLFIQNNTSLTSIFPSVSSFSSLRELNIQNSPLLGTIPDGIENLSSLESLALSKIGISSIPAGIGNLSKLRNLNLSCNNLTGLPQEISKLNNLEYFDIGGGREAGCGLNSGLKTLAHEFNANTDFPQTCEDIPLNFCVEVDSSNYEINLTATSPYTCASHSISNANFSVGFPSVDNTPWQNSNMNGACYYKCKIGFSGNDCLTVLPMTLFERLITYLRDSYTQIEPTMTFGGLTEYNGRLYFQDSDNALYSIDGSSEVIKVFDYIYYKPYVFNNILYVYNVDWQTETSYLTSIDSAGNRVDRSIYIPSGVDYGSTPMIIFNNKLYFWADTGNEVGIELAYIDASNNLGYIDINPSGSAVTTIGEIAYDFGVFNNKLYFWADGGPSIGRDLFSLDTSNNLVPINMNPSGEGLPTYKPGFQVFNNKMYFNVNDNGVIGEELYYIDNLGGTGYIDINPGISSSYSHNFFVYNNQMYFKGFDISIGWELFTMDTSEIVDSIDLYQGVGAYYPNSSLPRDYTLFNNQIYFIANLSGGLSNGFFLDSSHVINHIPESNDFFGDILGVFDNKLLYLNYNDTVLEYYDSSGIKSLIDGLNLVIGM